MEAPSSTSSRLSVTSGWTEAAGSEGLLLLEEVRLPRTGAVEESGATSGTKPDSEPCVGERSRNLKFSYVSPRSIYGETSNEGKESASTYPCRSLSRSVQVNGVDGVVLVVIQITDD